MTLRELPPHLRSSLSTVLARRGISSDEIGQIADALAASPAPDEITALLEAQHPERAAWIAAIDGHLHEDAAGYLLTRSPERATDYTVEEERIVGGGALCWSADGQFQQAFRYGPKGARRVQRPESGAVVGGDRLSDGAIDAHVLLEISGEAITIAALRERLARACDLPPALLEAVIAPLFDLVEIAEPRGGRLRAGTRITRRRFDQEIGRTLARALARLPVSADPRLLALSHLSDTERADAYYAEGTYEALRDAGCHIDPPIARPVLTGYPDLANLDEDGRLPGPGTLFDLGTFTVETGTLRATDPCHYRANAGKNDLPALDGIWRASCIVEPFGSWGPRVTELRAWAEGMTLDLDDVVEDAGFTVHVDAGLAGFFTPTHDAEIAASRPDFAELCCARAIAAGPAQATMIDHFGVVAFSGLGDGSYPCRMLQDAEGAVIAVVLDFQR